MLQPGIFSLFLMSEKMLMNSKLLDSEVGSRTSEAAVGGAGAVPSLAVASDADASRARIAELEAQMDADRAAILDWHRENVDDSQSQEALLQLYRMAELAGSIDLPLRRAKDYIAAHREKAAERARLIQAISDATATKLRERVPGYDPLSAAVRVGKAARSEAPGLEAVLEDTTQLRRLGEAAALSFPDLLAQLQTQFADMLAASEARMSDMLKANEARITARIDTLERAMKPLIETSTAASKTRIDALEHSLTPLAQSAFAARMAGVRAAELRGLHSPLQMRMAGFTAAELKAGHFTAAELKDGGFTAADLRAGGYSHSDLERAHAKCTHSLPVLCYECWHHSRSTWF